MEIELRCACHDESGLTRASVGDKHCKWCDGTGYIRAEHYLCYGFDALSFGPYGDHGMSQDFSESFAKIFAACACEASQQAYATFCVISAFCALGERLRN